MRECKRVINNKYEFRFMGELICSFRIGDTLYAHIRDSKDYMLQSHIQGTIEEVRETPKHTYLMISYKSAIGRILMYRIDIRYVLNLKRFDSMKGGFVNG